MTLISAMQNPRPAASFELGNQSVPKIRLAAFCETSETKDAVTAAMNDRRMIRARFDTVMGGVKSAILRYRDAPSPDLVIIERKVPGDLLLDELRRLSEVCDVNTRVIVISTSNDIRLYRELLDHGVSDYLVTPVDATTLIGSIVRLYEEAGAKQLGRTYAFVGAKGGVGSSTIAHNVAATIADRMNLDVILADMDLAFGTAGLDFNIDNVQGIAEALNSGSKLDELQFERLLGKFSNHLNMLTAPATLERPYDLGEEDFDVLVDIARRSAPHVIFDVPHVWSAWARRMLVVADEVIVTAVPDLANLRNTKNLVDFLRTARPNDSLPKLVLNQVGIAKRPEIAVGEFAKAIGIDPVAAIPFEPKQFGKAANNGRMLFEISPRTSKPFVTISNVLLESGTVKNRHVKGRGLFSFFPFQKI